ncbi:MAG: flagellar basal-body MS-ring/collar protein FliF [Paracoccaceae bacterium]
MQQIVSRWVRLTKRQQVIVATSAVAVFIIMLALSRLAASPSMQMLYSGLDDSSAGEVIHALEQRNVQYDVKAGTIFVEASQRDQLRMILAGVGIPANGGKGYELLDSLTGFGTTSQMFDAAYWRAIEGELARTIIASPFIRQARVHIANSGNRPFQRGIEPSASVSLVSRTTEVSPSNARAIRHLVASAVSGLDVRNVTVVNANGTIVGEDGSVNLSTSGESRATLLRERVIRLLEARVGKGNAIVEVSIDTVTETESIRERRIDPDSRIAISSDVEEKSNTSKNNNGVVSVASNLPDGDAKNGQDSQASTSSTRERVNYEVSETEMEIVKAPGSIRRLTVAVLVNDFAETAGNGEVVTNARPEEELESLRELVSSAVGLNLERGDVLTLKSMSLPNAAPAGTEASGALFDMASIDVMSLAQAVILGTVALLLGLFVVRPILVSHGSAEDILRIESPPPNALVDRGQNQVSETLMERGSQPPTSTGEITQLASPSEISKMENPVDRLRTMIGARQDDSVEILRGWLEEEREKVG